VPRRPHCSSSGTNRRGTPLASRNRLRADRHLATPEIACRHGCHRGHMILASLPSGTSTQRRCEMDRDSALDRASLPVPVATYEILAGGGIKLRAREWGNRAGPALLFIHGWSQSDLCWLNQVRGDLADTFRIVTFDLRGHGLSDKPPGSSPYADGRLWADDVASVIDQTCLEQPPPGGLVVRRVHRHGLSSSLRRRSHQRHRSGERGGNTQAPDL
jgi:hypothetical protein